VLICLLTSSHIYEVHLMTSRMAHTHIQLFLNSSYSTNLTNVLHKATQHIPLVHRTLTFSTQWQAPHGLLKCSLFAGVLQKLESQRLWLAQG